MTLYTVFQIEHGVNKLLSVCGSKDSLASAILHYNQLGYIDIKTKPFAQNTPYLNLFDNNELAFDKEEYKNIKE